jgi:hypothetical protein
VQCLNGRPTLRGSAVRHGRLRQTIIETIMTAWPRNESTLTCGGDPFDWPRQFAEARTVFRILYSSRTVDYAQTPITRTGVNLLDDADNVVRSVDGDLVAVANQRRSVLGADDVRNTQFAGHDGTVAGGPADIDDKGLSEAE